jgi:hypothetical protein
MSIQSINFQSFAEASAFARSRQGTVKRNPDGGFTVAFRGSQPVVATSPALAERVSEFTSVAHFQFQRSAIGFAAKVRAAGGTAWAKANKAGRWSVLFSDPSGKFVGQSLTEAPVVNEVAAGGSVQVWPAPSPVFEVDSIETPASVLAVLEVLSRQPNTLRASFDQVERQVEVSVRVNSPRSTTEDSAQRQAWANALASLCRANGVALKSDGVTFSRPLPSIGERRLAWVGTLA